MSANLILLQDASANAILSLLICLVIIFILFTIPSFTEQALLHSYTVCSVPFSAQFHQIQKISLTIIQILM